MVRAVRGGCTSPRTIHTRHGLSYLHDMGPLHPPWRRRRRVSQVPILVRPFFARELSQPGSQARTVYGSVPFDNSDDGRPDDAYAEQDVCGGVQFQLGTIGPGVPNGAQQRQCGGMGGMAGCGEGYEDRMGERACQVHHIFGLETEGGGGGDRKSGGGAVPSTTATGTFFIDLLGVGPSTGCILPQCWHSTDCTSLDEGCLESP